MRGVERPYPISHRMVCSKVKAEERKTKRLQPEVNLLLQKGRLLTVPASCNRIYWSVRWSSSTPPVTPVFSLHCCRYKPLSWLLLAAA